MKWKIKFMFETTNRSGTTPIVQPYSTSTTQILSMDQSVAAPAWVCADGPLPVSKADLADLAAAMYGGFAINICDDSTVDGQFLPPFATNIFVSLG
jgi:hypothetical protein